LGLVTEKNNSNEFRNAVASAFLVGTLEVLTKLPEAVPTLNDLYGAIRLGAIAGLAFYLANKGIALKNKKSE